MKYFIFILVLILAFWAGTRLGKSEAIKSIFSKGPAKPAEGSKCPLPDGTDGVIVNGLCTVIGDRPVDPVGAQRGQVPALVTITRGAGGCAAQISLANHPGYTFQYIGGNRTTCIYKRI